MNTFEKDRAFIEEKYHKKDGKYEEEYTKQAHLQAKRSRMSFHGYEYDTKSGLSDKQIREGLLALDSEIKDLPHPVAKAKAIEYVLKNTRIDTNEHDYFIGIYSWDRLCKSVTVDKWHKEVFEKIIPETGAIMKDLNDSGAVLIWPDYDHVVPCWDDILSLGFRALLERAEKYRKSFEVRGELTEKRKAYFDGIKIEYEAILDFIKRLYDYSISHPHEKTKVVSSSLKNIYEGAPQNFFDALQTMYIYFMVSESVDCYQVRSLGNGLDSTLRKFYENDIENGIFTREQIKEFLAYFLMQWAAIDNYWGQPLYLGGTNEDGTSKINDLSYDIIDVYNILGIQNPKIQIKVNYNTPKEFLNKIYSMIRDGQSSFVFCCEPGMKKAIMCYGATEKEARDFDIRGCYETGVKANEVSTGVGYINGAKQVLYVLNRGYDKTAGKQIGIDTGDIESLKTFEDFYNAVVAQWSYLIEKTIDIVNAYEKYLEYINPSSLYSATITHSLALGRDAYQDGVKFNNSAILNCGFASLVDSVMAVKEFVYDKKEITLSELKKALDANWDGYEALRKKIQKSPHKYGNQNPETDLYSYALSEYFCSKINNRPNARGGVYKAVMHAARYVWQGLLTSATPDGRKAGDVISKNASPTPGMDRNGVTALINSVTTLIPNMYHESFCIDVMLHPTAVAGDEGLDVMDGIVKTYMKNNGMSIQFNVLDTAVLRDAQKNPEKYKNLQVRVCGWNVLWNNMNKKEQNSFIMQADNIAQ